MLGKAHLLGGCGLALIIALPHAAHAQASPTPGDSAQIETLVVTARKQEERLLNVPVTVTALSATRLDTLGVQDFKSVSDYTPGVFFSSGSNQNMRSGQVLLFRGMTPFMLQNASAFIDGTPIVGGTFDAISDTSRVEVLKGPQSAYFGRNTFAGAINFVTKQPSLTTYSANLDVLAAEDNHYDVRASVEGPIFKDQLSVRLSARYFTRDGQYTNVADGSTLGDQHTKSASIAVHFTPNERFTANGFLIALRDDDGLGALLKVSRQSFNCNAGAAPTTSLNYFCGTLPTSSPIPLGQNADIDPGFRAGILNNSTGLLNPLLKDSMLDHPGSARHLTHGHIGADYDAGWVKISGLASFNINHVNAIYDGDFEDSRAFPNPIVPRPALARSYNNTQIQQSQQFDDYFGEVRATSTYDSRLRWLAGASFVHSQITTYANFLTTSGVPSAGGIGSPSVTDTYAAFGSLTYDFTDELSLSVEGRYQSDKVAAWSRKTFFDLNAVVAQATFTNFTPRAILKYQYTPEQMVYASYAQGVNPGSFNTSFLAFAPAVQERVLAATGAGTVVQPEKIENYEIGFKGRFWDGKAQVTAAAYYAVWTNQIIAQSFLDPTGVTITLNTNIGETELKGFEVEGELRPFRQLSLTGQFGYSDSEIKDYVCVACRAFAGPNVSVVGNSLYRAPKANGSFGAQYTDRAFGDFDFFVRGDYVYHGPIFIDETNLAKTKAQNVANFRAGLQSDRMKVEAFITNAFDDDAPNSGIRATDGLRGNAVDFLLGMPLRRHIGARVSYRFGG